MYRPSTINKHNESLKRFQKLFNSSEPYDVIMCEWAEISKLNDGIIIYRNQQIIFDWECRDDWYTLSDKCSFPYSTLDSLKENLRRSLKLNLQFNAIEMKDVL